MTTRSANLPIPQTKTLSAELRFRNYLKAYAIVRSMPLDRSNPSMPKGTNPRPVATDNKLSKQMRQKMFPTRESNPALDR